MTQLLHTTLIIPSPWRYNNIPTTTTTISPIQMRGWVLTGKAKAKAVVGPNWTIRCMANPRRVNMVAKQIRRELSDMLLTDNVLQFAVLPEASLGADCFLSSVTTITDVKVTADLQVVRVYVSVFGDERGKEVAIAGLKSKAKYVHSELGRRMKLRLTPEICFIEDESFERGSRPKALVNVGCTISEVAASPAGCDSSDLQKLDRISSSVGISSSTISGYCHPYDDGYSGGQKEKRSKKGRNQRTSSTPGSRSLSSYRLKSCDVFIGLHGRKPPLLRFAKWLCAELEIQGISCFVSDRAACKSSYKLGIAENGLQEKSLKEILLASVLCLSSP